VDFEELWQINPEIYGWIDIPGTSISYPIAQSASDDSYYLNHTIDGIAGYPGSIYTERVNSKDFTDFNTLIYGHDMLDGSMFAGLHEFSDADYLNEHQTMYIYTPEHIYTYRIFMTVTYDDRHIMNSFNFSDTTQRAEYLESIGNADPEVTIDSRLVTMSTCIATQPNNRFLVEAVLIDEK
jgi:sortase B